MTVNYLNLREGGGGSEIEWEAFKRKEFGISKRKKVRTNKFDLVFTHQSAGNLVLLTLLGSVRALLILYMYFCYRLRSDYVLTSLYCRAAK